MRRRENDYPNRIVFASPTEEIMRAVYAIALSVAVSLLPPTITTDVAEAQETHHDLDASKVLSQAVQAYRTKLAVIANNLANANTVAFKKRRVNFATISYGESLPQGTLDSNGQPSNRGISGGLGVRISYTQVDFRQGAFESTGRELDVAIEGAGFLQLMDASGDTLYTRAGILSLNAIGQLVFVSASIARPIKPAIWVPADTTAIVIGADGRVVVRTVGRSSMQDIGRLQLALFTDSTGLRALGANLYDQTDSSNLPIIATPGEDGAGKVRQGTLEASNVEFDAEIAEWNRTVRMLQSMQRLLVRRRGQRGRGS